MQEILFFLYEFVNERGEAEGEEERREGDGKSTYHE